MKPSNLPVWITGVQAVTWLATGDVELTDMAPAPRAFAPQLETREQPSGTPASDSIDRKSLDLREWGDDWFFWLRIRSGSDLRKEMNQLCEAARSGAVATRRPDGLTPIDPGEWARSGLHEQSPGLLLMFTPDRADRIAPLFARDDLLKLPIAHIPLAAPSPHSSIPSTRGPKMHQRIREWRAAQPTHVLTLRQEEQVELCRRALSLPALTSRTFRRAINARG